MSWTAVYRSRLTSAEAAVRLIEPGSTIVLGAYCAEPQTLVEALVADCERLSGSRLVTSVIGSPAPYARPEVARHLRPDVFLAAPPLRQALAEGLAGYIPAHYSQVSRLFRDGLIPVDVALIQTAPPDDDGYLNLGISVDYVHDVLAVARRVIVEVNARMPRTFGDTRIPLDRADAIVESDRPLLEVPRAVIGPVEAAIGRHVATLVPERATLQIGLGALPDAVLQSLTDREDLNLHSGLLTDGVRELMDRGVITNRHKPFDVGVAVTNTVAGTADLYRWLDGNPSVHLRPTTYTHDPYVAGQIPRFISINAALEVDLWGQVNAETLGTFHVSGTGGQADYVRAANRSQGGAAVIVLPSTAQDGRVSRIVPSLPQGAAVTTPRADVHFVVTEYGIADLRGKTLAERAAALIEVAHPSFREELREAARRLGRRA